jgi:hypothetical protein
MTKSSWNIILNSATKSDNTALACRGFIQKVESMAFLISPKERSTPSLSNFEVPSPSTGFHCLYVLSARKSNLASAAPPLPHLELGGWTCEPRELEPIAWESA